MEKEPNSTENGKIADEGDKKTSSASFGAYSYDLSQKNWDRSLANQRWDASPSGRAVIRVFSRGGLGAAAFAWGNWYASRGLGMRGYKSYKPLEQIVEEGQPLQIIAKGIDTFIGKPLKFIVKNLHGGTEEEANLAAEHFVNFRETNNPGSAIDGRSLGHEAVSVTFDFFCASVGDAFGRDLANLADPHVKHEWKDDKGNINYLKALESAGKSAFRYVTYNGGEDWAVAVPYVFYLRGQRNLINKFSKGFHYDSDRGNNGGSFKVDEAGNLTGNYNMAGLLDLQGRFTAYNVGTLMYRELYNHIDNRLHGINSSLYGSPTKSEEEQKNEPKGILHDIGTTAKWMARATIKGVVSMTPAVPFFSIFRTPQSKYKGMFIDPETDSVLGFHKETGVDDILHAHEQRRTNPDFRTNNPPVHFSKFENGKWSESPNIVSNPLGNPKKPFNAYEKTFGVADSALNKIGNAQNFVRSKANNIIPNNFFGSDRFGNNIPAKRIADTYVNAAFAYTPYMYAKAETARIWDSGKMDVAAERMIDGATSLDMKEFKAGAAEVWQTIFHPHTPFKDAKREAIAEQRIHDDTSPSDSVTKEQLKILHRDQYDKLPWKERIIQGRKPESEETEKTEKSHAEKFAKHDNYTSDVEMQKALRELIPPTNSIH